MTIKISKGATTLTGDGINFFRMLQLKGALSLEIKGIRQSRGFSAYATIKKEYNLKGNRDSVLKQFTKLVDAESAKQERIQDD